MRLLKALQVEQRTSLRPGGPCSACCLPAGVFTIPAKSLGSLKKPPQEQQPDAGAVPSTGPAHSHVGGNNCKDSRLSKCGARSGTRLWVQASLAAGAPSASPHAPPPSCLRPSAPAAPASGGPGRKGPPAPTPQPAAASAPGTCCANIRMHLSALCAFGCALPTSTVMVILAAILYDQRHTCGQ